MGGEGRDAKKIRDTIRTVTRMAEPKGEMVERRCGRVAPRDLRIAREFSASLAGHYDRSLFEVTFFGSRARGEGDEESDLDLFVALHQDDPGREVEATALRERSKADYTGDFPPRELVEQRIEEARQFVAAVAHFLRTEGVPID